MTVLITGGAGFLGTLLVNELSESSERPAVLDVMERTPPPLEERRVPYIKGTIASVSLLTEVMRSLQVRKVVHLAALLQSGCAENPKGAVEVNVEGMKNVLEACRQTGVERVVFASSTAVYGPHEAAVDERSPTLPGVSLYGVTKLLGEVLLEHYRRLYGVAGISLRFSGVYGPGEVQSPGLAKTIKMIESTILGEDVTIEAVASVSCHHFVFVKDVAQACLKALFARRLDHHVFNVTGGDDSYASFGHFYDVIRSIAPGAGKAIFNGSGHNRGRVDCSLARRELGYEPRFNLDQGIEEDVRMLRDQQGRSRFFLQ